MCNATKLCLNIIISSRELKLAKISLAWKAKQLRTEWNKTYLLLQSSDFHVTIRSRESTTKTTRLTKGSRQDVLLHATARFIYLGRRCVIMKKWSLERTAMFLRHDNLQTLQKKKKPLVNSCLSSGRPSQTLYRKFHKGTFIYLR